LSSTTYADFDLRVTATKSAIFVPCAVSPVMTRKKLEKPLDVRSARVADGLTDTRPASL